MGACLLLAGLAGCTHLLPKEVHTTKSSFESYDSARDAANAILPFKTTVEDLKRLGFDVDASRNVSVIPYPELVARLAPNPNVQMRELDPGIRECILAQKACRAYEFDFKVQERRRVGGFWPDFLNFRRLTQVSGWRLRALIVVRGDVVLFSNHGGEPHIEQTELRVNPLGPLQPAGEGAGAVLMR